MRNTVLFDLDGTLTDTLADLAAALNYCYAKNGFPQKSIEVVHDTVGCGAGELIHRTLPEGRNNPAYDKCLKEYLEYYGNHVMDLTKPYDGIIGMLDELKKAGYKMAIVTNKFDGGAKKLRDKFFKEYIPVTIGENDDMKHKPEPEMVLAALKELDAAVEDSIYVGDSEIDIQTAANSKMPCISVSWGFKTKEFLAENGAQLIVDTPEKLLEAILNFRG